jgi:hypothetical protein
MIARLLRRIVIWPIPPAYSGQAVATVLLTAVIVASAQLHSLPGVLAAVSISIGVVIGIHSLYGKRRTAE